MTPIAVTIAGALGALTRYWVGVAVGVHGFPWATLLINVTGSFLLGLILGGPGGGRWSLTVTTAVAVGFLGAFTTFSTFSFETLAMLRSGRVAAALAYASASVVVGLAAAAGGYILGRAAP